MGDSFYNGDSICGIELGLPVLIGVSDEHKSIVFPVGEIRLIVESADTHKSIISITDNLDDDDNVVGSIQSSIWQIILPG